MAIKSFISKRTVQLNAFNKNKVKGHYDVISDVELESNLIAWELESLAILRAQGCTKNEYMDAYRKYNNGGYVECSLVPYWPDGWLPEYGYDNFHQDGIIPVAITSRAGSLQEIEYEESISAYTNREVPKDFAKRFYTIDNYLIDELEDNDSIEVTDIVFEEVNFTNIINNDTSLKQTTLTISKVLPFEGDGGSYIRNVKFKRNRYSIYAGDINPEYLQLEFSNNNLVALGAVELSNIIGSDIKADIVYGDNYVGNYYNGSELLQEDYEFPYKTFAYISTSTGTLRSRGQWHPHFMVPEISGGQVYWQLPWVQEFWYSWEQSYGDYAWRFTEGSGNTDTINSDVALNAGEAIRPEDLFNSEEYFITTYSYSEDREFTGGAKEAEFFAPYGTEYALPNRLSSHAAGYVNENGDSTNAGLLNFSYSDSSHNGLHSKTAQGPARIHNSIFALDYMFDPTVFVAGGKLNFWLSSIHYGKFYADESLRLLNQSIIDGNAIYKGVSFKSDLGIMTDIKDTSVPSDIRKWSEDGNFHMLLMPLSTTELAGANNYKEIDPFNTIKDYKERTISLFNSYPILGPNSPRYKIGLIDFRPSTLEFNDTKGFSGHTLNPDYFLPSSELNGAGYRIQGEWANLLLDIEGGSGVRGWPNEIGIHYYGSSSLKIILFAEDYSILREVTIPSELKEGRTLSGGIKLTLL